MGAKKTVTRAVLDTNVIVSALILRGPTNQLSGLWQQEKFRLIVSKAVLTEYLRVLAYPKFKLSSEEVKSMIQRELLPFIHPVDVKEVPAAIPEDPSDNEFLACAEAGECHYLVSGDAHLLNLKHYKNIPIVSVADFLRILL